MLARADGAGVLVDPAAHGGHREVDLAMLRLFGGPGPRLHAAYEEAFPLPDGHSERVALWQLLPLLIHADRLGDAALTGIIQAMAEAVGREAFLHQQQAIMGRPDSRPSLAAVGVPTLVLAGREDAITPPELQQEMAAAVPQAALVLLPRCGHLSTLERPDAVGRQLLAWLEAA